MNPQTWDIIDDYISQRPRQKAAESNESPLVLFCPGLPATRRDMGQESGR